MSGSNIAWDPPEVDTGMTKLDRDAFRKKWDCLAVRIPASETTRFRDKVLKDVVLRPFKLSCIVHDSTSPSNRLLLLKFRNENEIPPEVRTVIEENDLPVVPHEIDLGYDYWSADQIFYSALPIELRDEVPSSFTLVGHIAHMNLRDQYLPYKYLIGQVILDKNPRVETVVNKVDTIDNEFRFFKMEVLAGKEDFMVETSEGGCTFRFDFSKVYWNSRLGTEHGRLVSLFQPSEIICDAFAGVGPFAVPAGKKGCGVMANDLNPESAKGLRDSIQLNRVGDRVRWANMDARDYIKKAVIDLWEQPFDEYVKRPSARERAKAVHKEHKERKGKGKAVEEAGSPKADAPTSTDAAAKEDVPDTASNTQVGLARQPPRKKKRFFDHFVMNLPASAVEFLDSYRDLYEPLRDRPGFLEALKEEEETEGRKLPMVHCYCFSKETSQPERDISERATQVLGHPVNPRDTEDFSVSWVRDVAPNKTMYRLSFRLSKEVVLPSLHLK